MFVEIREILGTKKYMNQESAIIAGSEAKRGGKGGKGKKGKKADSKGQITKKADSKGRSRSSLLATVGCAGEIRPQAVGVLAQHEKEAEGQCCSEGDCDGGKSVKCEHCGLEGHRRSECRRLKAEQAARFTSSSTTPLIEGDSMAKKRKKRHCGS